VNFKDTFEPAFTHKNSLGRGHTSTWAKMWEREQQTLAGI